MGIYVVEIEGKAIAAFGNADYLEAEEYFDSEPFKEDLICLTHDDRRNSLWNGKSELHMREATPEEAAKWEESRQYGINTHGADPDDTWTAFLVTVREPKKPRLIASS